MNNAHTPGPWILKSWHEASIVTRDGDHIASVSADKNRKLIAAAPDLLAALEAALKSLEHLQKNYKWATNGAAIESARAAIAKATG